MPYYIHTELENHLQTQKMNVFGLYAFQYLDKVFLSYFSLPVVFSTAALWMLVAAGFCRYIPKRLR